MNTHTRNKLIVVVVLLVLAVSYWYFFRPALPLAPLSGDSSSQNDNVISAMFTCAGGKAIGAEFSGDMVALSLSDGRNLTLPHALSADGARYANADESFVFWNKGNTAFIQENGKNTYTDCVTATAEEGN